jgi:glycosyltransferase involved in cell wall biosynthesis
MVNSPGFIPHVTARGARWVELVPNGADPDMFSPEAESGDFRSRNGLEDAYVALYAGAHGMANDLSVLLDAAQQLQAEPRIRIVLVGDGKEKAALQQRARAEGLENVLFLPPVPKEGMPAVLAAADCCIGILKPIELFKTTYPNKIFDYMAAGRPVILCIDGVIREVVESAQAGIFVPPGQSVLLAEAIQTLANDPQRGCRMGRSGREYVIRHFNRIKIAQQLALLLDDMRRTDG